jgi:hypothetical protein
LRSSADYADYTDAESKKGGDVAAPEVDALAVAFFCLWRMAMRRDERY